MEKVNHPRHYNQHPNGIECIDIIRHYTCDIANAIKYLWRAGLKSEMGKEDAEKEIEDLEKAIVYIVDYAEHGVPKVAYPFACENIVMATGHHVFDITNGFSDPHIYIAIGRLLFVGFIFNGDELAAYDWEDRLEAAVGEIRKRIAKIETKENL